MRGELIGRRSIEEVRRAVPIAPIAGYGLGLRRVKTTCGWLWGHDGGTFGYTSNAFVSGDGARVAIVLVNRGPLGPVQRTAFERLAEGAACQPTS